MHHFTIDRCAEDAGITVIALERGLHAQFFQSRFSRLFKIEGGSAWLYPAAHQFQHLADDLARAAHLFDLLRRFRTTATKISSQGARDLSCCKDQLRLIPASNRSFFVAAARVESARPGAVKLTSDDRQLYFTPCATAPQRPRFRLRSLRSAGLHPLPRIVPKSGSAR